MCVQHTTLHKYLKWVAEVKMLEVYVKLTGVSVTHTHTYMDYCCIIRSINLFTVATYT